MGAVVLEGARRRLVFAGALPEMLVAERVALAPHVAVLAGAVLPARIAGSVGDGIMPKNGGEVAWRRR